MITNPFRPGYYSRTNQILLATAQRRHARLIERYEDEEYEKVSGGKIEEFEVSRLGRTVKTNYIRYWIEKLGG